MRIIGGKFKARKIKFNARLKSRPTTDYAREGLFNVLEGLLDFDELSFMDCFSGSSLIGLEAISRGFSDVVAVDVDIWAQRNVLDIIKEMNITNYRFHRADVFRFLKKEDYPKKFDVVFADPPYNFPTTVKIPDLVLEGKWLKPDGLLVLEHGKDKEFEKDPRFLYSRSFGSVIFSFFKKA